MYSTLMEARKPVPQARARRALLRGLNLAQEFRIKYLAVFSDSRTLVNQVNNLWNKNEHLAELCEKAQAALKDFQGTQVSWVPRRLNKKADALVNKAFNLGDDVIHSDEWGAPRQRHRADELQHRLVGWWRERARRKPD
jgi:hypothetical protein